MKVSRPSRHTALLPPEWAEGQPSPHVPVSTCLVPWSRVLPAPWHPGFALL